MQLIISANNLVPLYSGFQDENSVNHKEKRNMSWEIKNRKPKNSNTYQIKGQNSHWHYSYSRKGNNLNVHITTENLISSMTLVDMHTNLDKNINSEKEKL